MTLATNWVDNIGMFVNAAYLNQVGSEVNANTARTASQNGTFSARPAANTVTAGTLYFCTDTDAVYQSDGTNWTKVRIGGAAGPTMADPPTSGWTAVNMQSEASFAQDKDGMLFTVPVNGSGGPIWQYQYRDYPTPPFTLTVNIDVTMSGYSTDPGADFGIVVSDGTKLIVVGPALNRDSGGAGSSGWGVGALRLTSVTAASTVYQRAALKYFGTLPKWYRYTDDGTNISLKCAVNGIDWVPLLASEARTAFMTPTRIGVGGSNDASGGGPVLMRIRSWNGVS